MRLTLTIQELKDKETHLMYKGVFGTLQVTLPDAKGKDKKQDINFVAPIKQIKGLEPIVEGIVTSVLALKKKNNEDKSVKTGEVRIPNRTVRRSYKKK